MNFSENGLFRKDRKLSFSSYCEACNRLLKFQVNFSEVFEVLSLNDGSNLTSSFPSFPIAGKKYSFGVRY